MSRTDELVAAGTFLRSGGWIGVMALLALASIALNLVQFVDSGRWADRYTSSEASRDWRDHGAAHASDVVAFQGELEDCEQEIHSWVDEQIELRVPAREVLDRLTNIEALLGSIEGRLDRIEVRGGR